MEQIRQHYDKKNNTIAYAAETASSRFWENMVDLLTAVILDSIR